MKGSLNGRLNATIQLWNIEFQCAALGLETRKSTGKPLGEWRIVNNGEVEQNGGTNNGTLKIIEENELVPLLEQGYEIVKELSNGKIVVRKVG